MYDAVILFLMYMLAAPDFVNVTPIQSLTTAVVVCLKLTLQSDFTMRAEIIGAICSEGVAVKCEWSSPLFLPLDRWPASMLDRAFQQR